MSHRVHRAPQPRTVAGLGKRHLACCLDCTWTYRASERAARDDAARQHEERTR